MVLLWNNIVSSAPDKRQKYGKLFLNYPGYPFLSGELPELNLAYQELWQIKIMNTVEHFY